MTGIRLVPIGSVDQNLLSWLGLTLGECFDITCEVEGVAIPPDFAYQVARQQYHSTALLKALKDYRAASHRVLGVAEVDLFIPILTFVFGEAQLNGRAALISACRLRQEYYGLPADDRLLYQRSEKEAIHELGHTFGLVHCQEWDCVMHVSNAVEQVDLKSNGFCPDCLSSLETALKALPTD
ncbi:MAG: archaemetzincin family Zn-dependent metalloprotease [Acidobacteriota bacterium]